MSEPHRTDSGPPVRGRPFQPGHDARRGKGARAGAENAGGAVFALRLAATGHLADAVEWCGRVYRDKKLPLRERLEAVRVLLKVSGIERLEIGVTATPARHLPMITCLEGTGEVFEVSVPRMSDGSTDYVRALLAELHELLEMSGQELYVRDRVSGEEVPGIPSPEPMRALLAGQTPAPDDCIPPQADTTTQPRPLGALPPESA
jgi:hypothetical protein